MTTPVESYKPQNRVRVVTATSLFDGHDASINIMRRILQDTGVEVIHIGHNRSAGEIVDAAIEEDAQGLAVSSYQGGHMEFFKYIVDLLKEKNAPNIKVFGGGGGVIIPSEIKELMDYGVARIYSPEDGSKMGLQGMINNMIETMDYSTVEKNQPDFSALTIHDKYSIANCITAIIEAKEKNDGSLHSIMDQLGEIRGDKNPPVIGLTGTGGAGKSSLTDELILRFLRDFEDIHIAVISCDPSRRKTGGALLGDRIRMNSIETGRVYMRSLATRESQSELPASLPEAIEVAKAAGFDLIIAETAGIGQGDSRIIDLVDLSIYVMTAEFGAPSQLEKIDMLDYADIVVLNKFEKRGSEDALRDVRKQVQRNRKAWGTAPQDMPVYGTIASKFNDDGVTSFYHGLLNQLNDKARSSFESSIPTTGVTASSSKTIIIPPERVRYLAEIADTVRNYHQTTEAQAKALRELWHLEASKAALAALPEGTTATPSNASDGGALDQALTALKSAIEAAEQKIDNETSKTIDAWDGIKKAYAKDELIYHVRGKEIRVPLTTQSLSHSRIPKVCIPQYEDPGELFKWMRKENVPGRFPYTAGVFPLKRTDEDPTRMFAGEGGPADTNDRRHHRGRPADQRLEPASPVP
jgi:methylmalonyl-CoA mutase